MYCGRAYGRAYGKMGYNWWSATGAGGAEVNDGGLVGRGIFQALMRGFRLVPWVLLGHSFLGKGWAI